jgi:hypothetical protein
MKSAYEIALGKLEATSPSRSLSDEQKARLAEIDSVFRSKIAQRKLALDEQLREAHGSPSEDLLRAEAARDLARLEEECEEKKEVIRNQN